MLFFIDQNHNVFNLDETADKVNLRLNLDTLQIAHQNIPFTSLKVDVQIGCKYLKICISSDVNSCDEAIVLEGELEHSIIAEESTHQIGSENVDGPNWLVVRLKKQTPNQPWEGSFVKIIDSIVKNCKISLPNDDDMEQIVLESEPNTVDQLVEEDVMAQVEREAEAIMKAEFTKAVFDEYENCDLQDSASSLVLTRFDNQTGQVLNEYDLSTQQWLFSMVNNSKDNPLPYFVTRHDVDAFIYEPQSIAPNGVENDQPTNSQFKIKHIDSFPAFGYVYASKQNRRFMTFNQEVCQQKTQFNYAIIDNWIDQLLYIYSKPSDSTNDKPCHGQQFLFHFDQTEETVKGSKSMIHGLCALPNLIDSDKRFPGDMKGAIYLLTEDRLCLFHF